MSLQQPESYSSPGVTGLQQRYRSVCEQQHRAAVRNTALVQDVRRLQHHLSLSCSQTSSQLNTLKQQYEQHVAAVYPSWLAEVDMHRQPTAYRDPLPSVSTTAGLVSRVGATPTSCATVMSSPTPVMSTLPLNLEAGLQHFPVTTASKVAVTTPITSLQVSSRQPDPLTTTLSLSSAPSQATHDSLQQLRKPSKIPVLRARVKPSSERIPPSSSIKKGGGTTLPGLRVLQHPPPSQPKLRVTLAVRGESVPEHKTTSRETPDSSLTSTDSAEISPSNIKMPPSDSFTFSSSLTTAPNNSAAAVIDNVQPLESPCIADSTLSPSGAKTPPSESLSLSSSTPLPCDTGIVDSARSPPVAESTPVESAPPHPVRPDSTDPLNLLDDLSMSSSDLSVATPVVAEPVSMTTTSELTTAKNVETEAVKQEKRVSDEVYELDDTKPPGEAAQNELLQSVSSRSISGKHSSATSDESSLSESLAVPLQESAVYRSLTHSLQPHSLDQDDPSLLLSEESAIADLEREIQSSDIADLEREIQSSDIADLEREIQSSAIADLEREIQSSGKPVEHVSQISNPSTPKRRLGFLDDSDSECDLPPSLADNDQDDFDFYS